MAPVKPPAGTFERWLLTIGTTLVAAGVMGLWSLNANVARLEERLAAFMTNQTQSMTHIERRLDRLENK